MKKIIPFLIITILLTACGNSDGKTLSVTDPSQPISVQAGDEFQIVIESNPTTGYHWEIVGELDGSLQFISKEYSGSQTNAVGSGGLDTWKFKATAPGETSITLGYYPPSNEPTEPQQTTTFKVIVK